MRMSLFVFVLLKLLDVVGGGAGCFGDEWEMVLVDYF